MCEKLAWQSAAVLALDWLRALLDVAIRLRCSTIAASQN